MTVAPSIRAVPAPPLLLSVLGIIGGCLGGAALVPDTPGSPASLQAAGAVFSLGLLIGPLRAALQRAEALLHPVALLLMGLVYWLLLDLIQARYAIETSSMQAVRLAFVAIGLFALGLVVAAQRRREPLPKLILQAARVPLPARLLFRTGVIAFILSILRFAIPSDFNVARMAEGLFAARFAAPWSRGAMGGWDAFLDHLVYFGYVLPALSVLLFRAEKHLTWRVLLLGAMAVLMGLFLAQGGGRRVIGALALSAGVVWVLTARFRGRALLTIVMFGLPALLMYLQYILLARNVGFGEAESIRTADLFAGGIAVDDNINRLAQLIEIIPAKVPHVGFSWLVLLLSRPIPRILWPGKPVGLDFNLVDYLGMQGFTLSSSVVGESYMAFGLIGCLVVGLVYGYFSSRLATLLQFSAEPGAVLMYVLGLMALFVGLRSPFDLLLFSYGILAWIALVSLTVPKQTRTKAE